VAKNDTTVTKVSIPENPNQINGDIGRSLLRNLRATDTISPATDVDLAPPTSDTTPTKKLRGDKGRNDTHAPAIVDVVTHTQSLPCDLSTTMYANREHPLLP